MASYLQTLVQSWLLVLGGMAFQVLSCAFWISALLGPVPDVFFGALHILCAMGANLPIAALLFYSEQRAETLRRALTLSIKLNSIVALLCLVVVFCGGC